MVVVGLTLTAIPLVTVMLPGVITPVPLAKTPVRLELTPAVIFAGLATKLVMVGAGTLAVTVTITAWAIAVPIVGVTVSVYVVVLAGLTLTAVPLVTGIFPGVIMPVPSANTPVRLELAPAAIVIGLATKLVMVGVDAALTVRENVVVTDKVPDAPLTMKEYKPGVAELLAVTVIVLIVFAELGLKDAVTPAGKPEAVRLTLPVNPFSPVTVI